MGAIFGGPIAGSIADRWGRKITLLLSGVPYLTGYLLLVYAHFIDSPVAFKAVVLIGRLISGVGLGWSCLAVPVSGLFHTIHCYTLAVIAVTHLPDYDDICIP